MIFSNNRLNQQALMKKYRIYNIILTIIFLGLLLWVGALFYQEITKNNQQINAVKEEKILTIVREDNTLSFALNGNEWQMTTPFSSKASSTVIEAFLERLHNNCQAVDEKQLPRELQYYAVAKTTNNEYHIGEINSATDRVYVKTLSVTGQFQQLALCDKLLVSMALSPAINFIDKNLYQGELVEIKGSFGSIKDFSGIDLSVLQIAKADSQQAKSASISDLTFISKVGDKTVKNTYQVIPTNETSKGQHIILFDKNKSIVYVVASNPKMNAIVGL